MHNKKENIVIVGAGLTGLALCNLLKGTNTSLSVLDSQPKSFYKKIDSDRNIVLSNTSMLIFKNIGIWEEIKKYCAEVKNIHISKKNIFGSTLLKSSDENLDALGYQIPIKHLIKILYKNIESEENIKFLNEARVINVKQGETVEIKYIQDSYENNIDSKSVIFSTGSTDSLFKDIFLEKVQKDYCQNAVTCEILSEKYNSETAFERFTSRGILGLIPRKENSWTLIYSTDQEESKIIENLDISSTKNYFQKLIGDKCGKFIEVKNIKIYPLKMKYYKDFVNKNICLLGDAAHTLHPIAAQSFNLSLRDCAYLTDMIKKSNKLENNDFSLIFSEYHKKRVKEVARLVNFTDFLASFVHGNGFIKNQMIGASFFVMDMNKNIRVNAIRYLLGINFSQTLVPTLKE